MQGAMRKRKRHDDDEDGDIDMDAKGGDDGWEDDEMDVDEEDTPNRKRAKKNDGAVSVAAVGARGPRTDRRFAGMRDQGQADRAVKLRNLGQRPRNMLAKAGEADRHIRTKMPKHLFSGKRKGGKTSRR